MWGEFGLVKIWRFHPQVDVIHKHIYKIMHNYIYVVWQGRVTFSYFVFISLVGWSSCRGVLIMYLSFISLFVFVFMWASILSENQNWDKNKREFITDDDDDTLFISGIDRNSLPGYKFFGRIEVIYFECFLYLLGLKKTCWSLYL